MTKTKNSGIFYRCCNFLLPTFVLHSKQPVEVTLTNHLYDGERI
jgi:hypothetical protein